MRFKQNELAGNFSSFVSQSFQLTVSIILHDFAYNNNERLAR